MATVVARNKQNDGDSPKPVQVGNQPAFNSLVRSGGIVLNHYPRVAFLPDTFSEVNGVAHTARQLEGFARRRQIPFLSVHCGARTEAATDGAVSILELKRSRLRIALDANLDYDPFLWRYSHRVAQQVRSFGAQLIHVTGPGDMGAMGVYVAWLLNLPLVISWHTSLHEYAGVRLQRFLHFAGPGLSQLAGDAAENASLKTLRWFYRQAVLTMAPNQELVELTSSLTQRPAHLMRRGVDTLLFTPSRRTRSNDKFLIGYVGRLTPEKNVRFLAELASALLARGHSDVEFVIVGEGSEEAWLRTNVPHAKFTGVLRGESLANAYAQMDLFAFPSHTDTFGNVVLEAMASAIPAVVTNSGGPKFIVRNRVTGYVAASDADFVQCVENLKLDVALRARMRQAARGHALCQSWDEVFESLFHSYREGIESYASSLPIPHASAY